MGSSILLYRKKDKQFRPYTFLTCCKLLWLFTKWFSHEKSNHVANRFTV